MARGRPFAHAFRRLPYLTSIPWQCTFIEPARSLYEEVAALETGDVRASPTGWAFRLPTLQTAGRR